MNEQTALLYIVFASWVVWFVFGILLTKLWTLIKRVGTTLIIGWDPRRGTVELKRCRPKGGTFLWDAKAAAKNRIVLQGDFRQQEIGPKFSGGVFFANLQTGRLLRLRPRGGGDVALMQEVTEAMLPDDLPEDTRKQVLEAANKTTPFDWFLEQFDGFGVADVFASQREQNIRRNPDDWKTKLMGMLPALMGFLILIVLIIGFMVVRILSAVSAQGGAGGK